MKRNKVVFMRWQTLMLALMLISKGLLAPAYSQTGDPALLLQQSPAQGGEITPSTGIHHYDLNSDVTLTALPKPGYQFIYWLGDVSDTTANSTTVYIDGPKIVIAVFEQIKHEFVVMETPAQSAPGGGMIPSAADYAQQGAGGGAPGRRTRPRTPTPPPQEPLPDVLPVPKMQDFPVPIPEPATSLLLVLGSLFTLARHRPKRQVSKRKADR